MNMLPWGRMPESHRPSADVVVCVPWSKDQQTVSPVVMVISSGEKKLLRVLTTTTSARADPAAPARSARAANPPAIRANVRFIGAFLSTGSRRRSGRGTPAVSAPGPSPAAHRAHGFDGSSVSAKVLPELEEINKPIGLF